MSEPLDTSEPDRSLFENRIRSERGQVGTADKRHFLAADGSLFDVVDLAVSFERPTAPLGRVGLWRYLNALPFAPTSQVWKALTMGEGWTPLIQEPSDAGELFLKLEFANPTGSFKDRGAVVMLAKAVELGVTECVVDSSGNAGSAVAGYAARAGITCHVFVPATNSPAKLRQAESYGAKVHRVPGSREDVAAAALDHVVCSGAFYASHVYNPYFLQGTKTFAFEIWEQLGGRIPDVVILPVGNGTLVLGAAKGFADLQRVGMIERMPRIVAVQSASCAPIYAAFAAGASRVQSVPTSPTLAEGIAIAAPKRGDEVLAAIRRTGGEVITVTDQEVELARAELAARGFFVEPTASVAYAGYRFGLALRCRGGTRTSCVVPLCSLGLKSG